MKPYLLLFCFLAGFASALFCAGNDPGDLLLHSPEVATAYIANRISTFFLDRLITVTVENPVYEEDPVIRPTAADPENTFAVTVFFSKEGRWLHTTRKDEVPVNFFADPDRADTFFLVRLYSRSRDQLTPFFGAHSDIGEFEWILNENENAIEAIGCAYVSYNHLPASTRCALAFESEPDTVLIDGIPYALSGKNLECPLTEGAHCLAACRAGRTAFFSFEVDSQMDTQRFFIPQKNQFPITLSSLRYYSDNAPPPGYYEMSEKSIAYYGIRQEYRGKAKAFYLIPDERTVYLRETVLADHPVDISNPSLFLYSALPVDGLFLVQFVIVGPETEVFSRYFTVRDEQAFTFVEPEDRVSIMDSEWFTYLSEREDLEVLTRKSLDIFKPVSLTIKDPELKDKVYVTTQYSESMLLLPSMFLAAEYDDLNEYLYSPFTFRDGFTEY